MGEMFPLALVMVLVSVWRMLETQSALFPTNEDLLEPSPLLLAVRMAPSVMLTAFGTETSLELVSTSGLSALVEVENPGQVFLFVHRRCRGFCHPLAFAIEAVAVDLSDDVGLPHATPGTLSGSHHKH